MVVTLANVAQCRSALEGLMQQRRTYEKLLEKVIQLIAKVDEMLEQLDIILGEVTKMMKDC